MDTDNINRKYKNRVKSAQTNTYTWNQKYTDDKSWVHNMEE